MLESISGKAPHPPHPACAEAAGSVGPASTGGTLLGLLMLLARQTWGACLPSSRERSCNPAQLQPALEHKPICTDGGQQGRSGCWNTFGLNRECRHISGDTAEAPESAAPPRCTGRICAAVSEESRQLALALMYSQTHGDWHLFGHHKFHHFRRFEDLLKIFISLGFSFPTSMQTNNQIVGSKSKHLFIL